MAISDFKVGSNLYRPLNILQIYANRRPFWCLDESLY
jgi:hypothetical protein